MAAPRDWREKFLAALRLSPSVTAAAAAAGVPRRRAYRARAKDAAFDRDWQSALAESIDAIEASAFERATTGTRKPVRYRGRIVGYVYEPSDSLAMFLLRAHLPERYRDRIHTHHETPMVVLYLPRNGREDPEVEP